MVDCITFDKPPFALIIPPEKFPRMISFKGSVTNPDCKTLIIQVTYDGLPYPTVLPSVKVEGTRWTVDVSTMGVDPCGKFINIEAHCVQDPSCTGKFQFQEPLVCDIICPQVKSLTYDLVKADDCLGVTPTTPKDIEVVLIADTIPPGGKGAFDWSFGDGTPDELAKPRFSTHKYKAPGTYTVKVTFHPDPIYGTSCSESEYSTTIDLCTPVCPRISSVKSVVNPDDCLDVTPATTKDIDVIFIAETIPAGSTGTFDWSFGDGSTTSGVANHQTHVYTITGSSKYTVKVAYRPDPSYGSCIDTSTEVEVQPCIAGSSSGGGGGGSPGGGGGGSPGGGGGGSPGGGGGGSPGGGTPTEGGDEEKEEGGCIAWRVTTTIVSILMGIALTVMLCAPGSYTILVWIVAGLLTVAVLVNLVAWATSKRCPKPCGWALLLGWEFSLGLGLGMTYFSYCCPTLYVPGLALITAGIGGSAVWMKTCHKSLCAVAQEMLLVLSGIILPIISALLGTPLKACFNPIVGTIYGLLILIFTPIAKSCESK